MTRITTFLALIVAGVSLCAGGATRQALAGEPKPAALQGALAGLPGRWTGEGRLGFKDGKAETVTCRATYFAAMDAPGLKQTIRCGFNVVPMWHPLRLAEWQDRAEKPFGRQRRCADR